MLAPKSWLHDYITITLEPKTLAERLTEVGLNTEKITKLRDDLIFDIEITPNRPDLLSMIGVALEIAAIEGKQIQYPQLKTDLKPTKEKLPITIKTNAAINPRFTAIIIDGITIKESPKWLKDRLEKIGQRSINNIVDITNYVMYELGNPIHAFDYNTIAGQEMTVTQAKGGEEFKSVDGILYHLPKGAVIIKDQDRIIDLCGIKGGANSGIYEDTTTTLIRVPVEVPVLIRRASQALSLRSDASSIFERAVNAGGTIDALKRCVDLILEYAGGEIASDLIDKKEEQFKPWQVQLRLERLNQILGIEISEKEAVKILTTLNLSPVKTKEGVITTTVPTYRNDLHIEEDLIEEVARMYGYNNFPKTLPNGNISTQTVPYYKDYRVDEEVKHILTACGFSEIYTYSLLSEKELENNGFNSEHTLRVDNPVSRDFEYLRPTLKINLLKALRQNKSYYKHVSLFELGKVYLGKTIEKAEEGYFLSGITNQKSFYEVKGILEKLFLTLGVTMDPSDYIDVHGESILFELPYTQVLEKAQLERRYIPIPKYPAVVEDMTVVANETIKTGDMIKTIKEVNSLITKVTLYDQYQDTRTFRILYQSAERNLTKEDVATIREEIKEKLTKNLHASIK